MTKTKKIGYVVSSLLVVLASMASVSNVFAVAGTTPKSGTNYVSVDSCEQKSNGVMVGKFGGTPYFLSNGVRDAGHGLRNYKLTCTSNKQYKVEWTDMNIVPLPPLKTQPKFDSLYANLKNANGTTISLLPVVKNSYSDTNGYFSLGTPVTVKNNVQNISLSVGLQADPFLKGLTYGFAWITGNSANLVFDESSVKNAATGLQMSSINTGTFSVTDYYRGKNAVIYAFVSNNDGISKVPNMPFEVDDVIPMYVQFEATTPTQSCGNSAGSDGLYSACVGDTISHSAPLTVKVEQYTNSYVHVKLSGVNTTDAYIKKGNTIYVKTNNNKWFQMTYTDTSEKFGAFIQITQLASL